MKATALPGNLLPNWYYRYTSSEHGSSIVSYDREWLLNDPMQESVRGQKSTKANILFPNSDQLNASTKEQREEASLVICLLPPL